MQSSTWSTQQLAEFLAAVSSFATEDAALHGAIERASEALDAEVGALVRDGRVVTSVGFPAGRAPEEEIVAVAEGRSTEVAIPGNGPGEALAAPLEDEHPSSIVVARSGGTAFLKEEVNLLRGMARVLALTLRTLRLLSSLREREALLRRLAAIQRSISRHAPRQKVLHSIASGARELIGDEFVVLRLRDADDPDRLLAVASSGVRPKLMRLIRVMRRGQGLFTDELFAGHVVVVEGYETYDRAVSELAADRLQAAMAAPVHENGIVIGGLVVASYSEGRVYSAAEQEMLLAFAEHASLALAGAKAVEDIEHQTLHDPLTGLPNRVLFLDRLEHRLARARRERQPAEVAVLFIDLDRFKDVNDRLGHAAGDELLIAVAERLRAGVRASDTAARLGGDEFAVVLEDTGDRSAPARTAERFLERLRLPFVLGGREVYVTASVGIAYGHEQGDALLRDADVAMYLAKSRGAGSYEFFQPGMRAALLERLELEAGLRHAVERGELLLHYQPIVELGGGSVIGVEALVRWAHPERGLLGPLAFIPLAEKTGAIAPIGAWVLREACSQTARWQERARRPLSVAVNLSGYQLQDPRIVQLVSDALAGAGLAPSSLTLEITETVLMQDAEAATHTLEELKALGVRLALDDFGTGYSSLRYLQQFPLDAIKIAKPFVDTVAGGPERSVLARAIVDLGKTFGLEVVAEGIERPEQLAALRELGCGFGQGYLLGRPSEAPAVGRLLRPRAPARAGATVRLVQAG